MVIDDMYMLIMQLYIKRLQQSYIAKINLPVYHFIIVTADQS